MKLSMEESAVYAEPEVLVRYSEMDEPLRRVVAAIRLAGGTLIGRQEARSHVLKRGGTRRALQRTCDALCV